MKPFSRLLLGMYCAIGAPLTLLCWVVLLLPYPAEQRLREDAGTSYRIVDREGALLREAVGASGARAQWMALHDISPLVVSALIAIEDRRFYTHGGVDPSAVVRAILGNAVAGREISGASTLTMQLARTLGRFPRSPVGKLRQAFDAVRIERAASKEQILEQYLNRVSFAPGTLGIEAASERIFGTGTRQLTLAQAALLAGLAQAPSGHNPWRHRERALARRTRVLDAMADSRVITEEQRARADAEALVLRDGRPRPEGLHFTDHVLARGPAPGIVHTTLDRDLQAIVQRMTAEHVLRLRSDGMQQAAVVILDNERCDVLTMVGSADWWGVKDGRNNGATALRQPGSTLKPFLYGLAFDRGFDPASVAADIPTRYPDAEGLLMHPRNYSEHFTGPVLLSEALGRSLNVPAVRLANAVGIEEVLEVLRASGLVSLDEDVSHYGLGLVLGNGEVTLLELASAYAMLARGGIGCTPRVLQDSPIIEGERVLSERSSYLVRGILSDEALRARAFGYDNPLMIGFPVAVKTGTSSNWRDSLAVGFTDRHTIAVWTGDFSGHPMERLSGAVGAGPLFREIARELAHLSPAQRKDPEQGIPEGIEEIEVCALSGRSPTEHCPVRRALPLSLSDTPRDSCGWHHPIRIDIRNGLRASDRCPARYTEERVFAVLPAEYALWQRDDGSAPPTDWSPLCPADGLTADAVVITHPRPHDVFLIEPGYDRATQSIELTAEVDPPVSGLTWWVDGQKIAESSWPYEGAWTLSTGVHELVAVAGDRKSAPVRFEVR